MRKIVVAAWLAVTAMVAAVPAASQISLPPLAPGEVLVEVSGIGVALTPATSAVLNVPVSASADTEAEARRTIEAAVRRVTAAARAAGVAPGDIDAGTIMMGDDPYLMTTNGTDMLLNAADSMADAAMSGTHYGITTIVIRMRDPRAAAGLQSSAGDIENVGAVSIEYALDDDSAARREARADAVRKARADAEAHAASMNMRVARLLRITERTGTDIMSLMMGGNSNVLRDLEAGQRDGGDGRIQTFAVVGLDYALAPR